jgi:hypothetical protein
VEGTSSDKIAPVVSALTARTAGIGKYLLSLSAQDNVGVVAVDIERDGVRLGGAVSAGGQRWEFTSPTLELNRVHQLRAAARDAAAARIRLTSSGITQGSGRPRIDAVLVAAQTTLAHTVNTSVSGKFAAWYKPGFDPNDSDFDGIADGLHVFGLPFTVKETANGTLNASGGFNWSRTAFPPTPTTDASQGVFGFSF